MICSLSKFAKLSTCEGDNQLYMKILWTLWCFICDKAWLWFISRPCHREINHQSVYSIKPRKRNTRCNFNKQLWKRTLRPVLARLRLEITATQKMMRVWLKQKCTTGNQPTWSVATGRDTGRYLLETNLKSGLVSNRYLPDQYGLCVLLRHAICLSPYIPTRGTCLLF